MVRRCRIKFDLLGRIDYLLGGFRTFRSGFTTAEEPLRRSGTRRESQIVSWMAKGLPSSVKRHSGIRNLTKGGAMKRITFCLSFYNQNKTLSEHIELWMSYPEDIKEQLTFFIIDDCSRTPAQSLIRDMGALDIDLHLYRIQKDLYCNIAGVRNLGAQEAKTPWILIMDMDTLVPPNVAAELIRLAKTDTKHVAYRFNRVVPENPHHEKHRKLHPAVCLIRKEDYWRIGGCEEDLVGHYGYTDLCFWLRARGKVELKNCENICLIYRSAGEADIQRDAEHNEKLFKERQRKANWSNTYIRFPWRKDILS